MNGNKKQRVVKKVQGLVPKCPVLTTSHRPNTEFSCWVMKAFGEITD